MKDEIATISYTESDWPKLMAEKLTIDAVNRKIIIDNKDERMIRKCTEADWQKIEHLISKCNFMQWKENYFEPVLDGTSWNLEIKFTDGRTHESHGSNGYPDEWKQFLSLKRLCRRLMKQDD